MDSGKLFNKFPCAHNPCNLFNFPTDSGSFVNLFPANPNRSSSCKSPISSGMWYILLFDICKSVKGASSFVTSNISIGNSVKSNPVKSNRPVERDFLIRLETSSSNCSFSSVSASSKMLTRCTKELDFSRRPPFRRS